MGEALEKAMEEGARTVLRCEINIINFIYL